jgi:RsiW-degrading membrane proteinase PrsW (M82 family)
MANKSIKLEWAKVFAGILIIIVMTILWFYYWQAKMGRGIAIAIWSFSLGFVFSIAIMRCLERIKELRKQSK